SVPVTELANHQGDTTSIDGGNATILFTDADLNDAPPIPTVSFVGAFGPHVTPALQAALTSAAHVFSFQDATNGGQGQFDVTFGVPDSTFDFLSRSQPLTVVYNVTLTDDDNRSISTRQVVIS